MKLRVHYANKGTEKVGICQFV